MTYKPTTVENYDGMDTDTAMEYSLDLLEIALIESDYVVARRARESIASLWRSATVDFGPLYVARVMHGYRIDEERSAPMSEAYVAHGMTFEREGGTYVATWSLHS